MEKFITVGQKRNRSSPDGNRSDQKVKSKRNSLADGVNFIDDNPFKVLETDNPLREEEDTPSDTVLTPKPPPIFINKVQDILRLHAMLNKLATNGYTLKVLNATEVKVQIATSDKYLPVIDELKKLKADFYTFRRKEDKPFRAVLRGMHPNIELNMLKSSIEEFGHTVIGITNIKQRITKNPLPLFFVDIKPSENNKEIYNITRLANLLIKFEPPRFKREIPQCIKCQAFGHTKNYCNKRPVCVKCAEMHLTSECPLGKKIKNVKCANCGGDHPANYKGCPKHKQLQQKLFPTLRARNNNPVNLNSQHITAGNTINSKVNKVNTNKSYAQALSTNNNNNNNTHDLFKNTGNNNNSETNETVQPPQINTQFNTNNTFNMEKTISLLLEKIDNLVNVILMLVPKLK